MDEISATTVAMDVAASVAGSFSTKEGTAVAHEQYLLELIRSYDKDSANFRLAILHRLDLEVAWLSPADDYWSKNGTHFFIFWLKDTNQRRLGQLRICVERFSSCSVSLTVYGKQNKHYSLKQRVLVTDVWQALASSLHSEEQFAEMQDSPKESDSPEVVIPEVIR